MCLLASQMYARRMDALQDIKEEGDVAVGQRKNILTNLILVKHPDTGERLTQADLGTEAFGFM